MRQINCKSFLPGFVSIVIIVGMAIQSLATNVDMAAFVKKDTYMTKYYELDWRIDEIEKNLERMYKFTCTNVVSFAGSGAVSQHGAPWRTQWLNRTPIGQNAYGNTYLYMVQPIAFFDDPNYLRFQKRFTLVAGGTGSTGSYRYHTTVMEKEYPASVCKWGNGIEPAPSAKVKIKVTESITGGSTDTTTLEYIFGPFKKIPKYTGYGQNNGKFVILPDCIYAGTVNNANLSYAYGRETQPTSWTSISSTTLYTYGYYPTGVQDASGWPDYTKEDIERDAYSRRNQRVLTNIWFDGTTLMDLSSYENVWIRYVYSSSSATDPFGVNFGMGDFTVTSWNYNK